MDSPTRRELVELIRTRGIAALGTLHGGAPLVSMVLYATSPDLSTLFIHVSHLAQHTAALLNDRRVGLLIAEPDKPSRNPLAMARVSIQAVAEPLEPGLPAYEHARAAYVTAHPAAAHNFELGGFVLVAIKPTSARFVAGFGRIVDIDAMEWSKLTAE
jgi:putative heme iron utilization protein